MPAGVKRIEYIDLGLSIGMSRRDILILTTPGELHDLLQLRSNRESERKGEKKNEQF